MSVYELSIEPALVKEAERAASLEGRGFPSLVMRWETKMFGQTWEITIVLDYTLALPPLKPDVTFHPVRVAAYVGDVPTKYFYFGTEMNDSVPRVAPEMENLLSPQGSYLEFQLDETTCPIPYTKLIQATPRIYGNGAQDYYAPPVGVERYDAAANPDLLADLFPKVVADLDPTPGSLLVDPDRGFWDGARYIGIRQMAIVRQGKVVGLAARGGRVEKDQAPPDVVRRDPKRDIRDAWVAVDVGARTTTVAIRGARMSPQLIRIGTREPPVVHADFETPSEICLNNVGRALKSWRDRVILPMTRFEDVRVGHASRGFRTESADKAPVRAAATITDLTMVRERVEKQVPYPLFGVQDQDTTEKLKKPAPPIVDEDGIGAHDPFDPIELFAYQVGLHVNNPARGIHTRYAITMPTGWTDARRQSVLIAFRRGFFRSLPAGMVEYHDLENLVVEDARPTAINFAAYSFRAFSISPKDGPINFGIFEVGATEAGLLFGTLREANSEERRDGKERVFEYLEPSALSWLGGERLLHRLAYRVYVASEEAVREARVPFEKPEEEDELEDAEELIQTSAIARANVVLLKDLVRPLLEGDATARVASSVKLLDLDRHTVEVPLRVERVRLKMALDDWFAQAAAEFAEALRNALNRIARGSDPYDGLRIILGGRVSMNPKLQEQLEKLLPDNVRLHRFREPDRTNLGAPTVKTAAALGVLSLKYDPVGAARRLEERDAFRFRVGRARHGQLADTLDPSVEYDEWREMGACNRPDIEVRFMSADDDGEVAADDPRVMRSVCNLGIDAVGKRVYLRAVGTTNVEVAVGPPGGEPDDTVSTWFIDLTTGAASPSS
jgi:hypothetical protein